MEHFTINGNLFLAFANYKSDIAGKYNTDSFMYKFNDSTRKFSPYQNISTNGGQGVEYFKISDEHYLAVANGYNGVTRRLNSVSTCVVQIAELGQKCLEAASILKYEPLNSCITVHSV